MGGVLANVDRFTRLAGYNTTALLLFRLDAKQHFAINVFKVREVLRCPPLNRLPTMHVGIAGSMNYRGRTIPVLDLVAMMGYPPITRMETAHIIVSEFSRTLQAFLVLDVDRILHCEGKNLEAPMQGVSYGARVSAITRVDGEMIAIIDVEQILAEISGDTTELSSPLRAALTRRSLREGRILVVDDSIVARRKLIEILQQLNMDYDIAHDGREALEMLQEDAASSEAKIILVISDIEMPILDGYALTTAIRADSKLSKLKVILHTSLSGTFNEEMVSRVGANAFIAKFQPDELANTIIKLLEISPAI